MFLYLNLIKEFKMSREVSKTHERRREQMERKAVESGQLKKHITEIILNNSEQKLFESVKSRIVGDTGFEPKKWQLMTRIFTEGLKSLDQKIPQK